MILADLLQSASNAPSDASALESSISALESAISALESAVKVLESKSPPWEYSVWLFTFLVVVGVALELWVIRHEWRDDMEAWALAHFGVLRSPGRPSRVKLRVEVASVLLITIGVMGELVVGIHIASINGELRGKSAELRSKNSELRSKSDQLLALMTREAAQLLKQAEDEHLARVKIEDAVAWRTLTKAQIRDLKKVLKPFPGKQATILRNLNDVEASAFASDIGAALSPDWKVFEQTLPIVLEPNPTPIEQHVKLLQFGISITNTSDERSANAADALIQEFVTLGFDAKKSFWTPGGSNTVFIIVNHRPEGPQGEAKLKVEAIKKKAQNAQPAK